MKYKNFLHDVFSIKVLDVSNTANNGNVLLSTPQKYAFVYVSYICLVILSDSIIAFAKSSTSDTSVYFDDDHIRRLVTGRVISSMEQKENITYLVGS